MKTIESVLKGYDKIDVVEYAKESGVREGRIIISLEQIRRMSEGYNVPLIEVFEYVVEHENTHMKKSDGYIIKTYILKTGKNLGDLRRFFEFYLSDEKRVMKEAKRFPCSDVLDEGNLRSIRGTKKAILARLKMGLPVGLRVRGCECEKALSLKDIEKRRKK